MANLLLRTLILYFVTLLAMKAMGKRQLGQLQPFEVVVLLIISEMASLSMQSNTSPVAYSVIPILTVSLLQVLLSLINLRFENARDLICGRPVVLIERGRLNRAAMRRQRLNISDLQELCRAQGYFDLSAVDHALLETNGSLSVLLRTEKRPVQVDDILTDPPQEQFPRLLIKDGRVDAAALRLAGYDRAWLDKQLAAARVRRADQVFLAGLDDQGQFFVQARDGEANS